MFKPLQRDEVFEIIDLQIDEVEEKIRDRQMTLDITDEGKEYILNRAYSSQYGARPVNRFIQKEIETNIGRLIIRGDLKDKDGILIDVENGQLSIKINS